jgi:hypothetical protein
VERVTDLVRGAGQAGVARACDVLTQARADGLDETVDLVRPEARRRKGRYRTRAEGDGEHSAQRTALARPGSPGTHRELDHRRGNCGVAGCILFGLGIGSLATPPGLILAVEWPRERFSALVGLVVGLKQFTFAFGPSLIGVIRDWRGGYGPDLGAYAALQATAAALVVLGPGGRQRVGPCRGARRGSRVGAESS